MPPLIPDTFDHIQSSEAFCMYTKGTLLSNIVPYISINLCYSQDNPPTSQVWHIKILFRQHDYHTGKPQAANNKGHFKMCSCSGFFLGKPPFTSCSEVNSTSQLVRVLIVKCWSTPLQWLCKVARYWQELEHAVIDADPERHKHAHIQWVFWPYRNWDISASRSCVHILAIWGRVSCCNLSW